MGRDLIRHQQPVGRRAPVWVPYAVLVVVLAVAGLALWRAAAPRDEGGGSGPSGAAQALGSDASVSAFREDGATVASGAGGVAEGAGATGENDESGAPDDGGRGADEPDAPASGARRALDALARSAERGEAESAQRWVCAEGLVEGAREALEAYREDAGVSLLAYGYLDVSGNVWGALLACPGAWVDLLVAQELRDGEGAEIAVARFSAEVLERQGM